MSSCSYNEKCPMCGGKMYCSSDTKDIRSNMGDCINCGWHYWTEEGNMNLSNVNEVRDCIGLKPIKKLRKQYL